MYIIMDMGTTNTRLWLCDREPIDCKATAVGGVSERTLYSF